MQINGLYCFQGIKMTIKEDIINIINQLPSESDFDQIMQALYIRSKFYRGEKQLNQNQTLSHEEAVKEMRSWQK
jgi:hypothetical protein